MANPNQLISTVKLYYNPTSKMYSAELWEGNEVIEQTNGGAEAIGDWLFCLSLDWRADREGLVY